MKRISLSLVALLFMTTSCEEDKKDQPASAQLPDTYNFENVSYSGQEYRISMLDEIVSYAKSSNNGDAVSAEQLFNMYANTNYNWSEDALNITDKDIQSKLATEAGAKIGAWINKLDTISQNPGTGSNGQAGIVSSNSGNKQYLLDENGFELAQLIDKGSMGALAYYQATSVYLGDQKMDVDNETVEAGKGTAMQHHWDEAFGYWGVPRDFGSEGFTYDSQAEYARFWAKYTNAVNDHLNSNAELMQAFIKGRDAINREDYDTRDAAIEEVRSEWEQVVAAMAIHYLNGGRAEFADDALRCHQLSEAYGFIWSLKFNPSQEMSDSEIDQILNDNFDNLYDISVNEINTVRDLIAERYGLKEMKDNL